MYNEKPVYTVYMVEGNASFEFSCVNLLGDPSGSLRVGQFVRLVDLFQCFFAVKVWHLPALTALSDNTKMVEITA